MRERVSELLVSCGQLLPADGSMWLAVLFAGLLGSLAHCSVMCSPAVMAQMLSVQQSGRKPAMMWFYHAGRISTYVFLGVVSALASALLFAGALDLVARMMLLLAGLTFVLSALIPRKTHSCCYASMGRLGRRTSALPFASLQLYARGFLMGFMPCGLVLSMLLMVAATAQPSQAGAMMLLFGVATLPVLQAAAFGALSLGKRFPLFGAKLMRAGMAINGVMCCAIGLNWVHFQS